MKRRMKKSLAIGAVLTIALAAANGATLATARVGTLEYVEGKVFVNGTPVQGGQEKLPVVEQGAVLSTADGHAEMLLTPGVFLRLDRGSGVELTAASLTDTRVRLERGAAMVEVDDLHKENLLRLQDGEDTVQVLKPGLYRLESEPARVEVLKGEATALEGDRSVKVGGRHEVTSPGLKVTKFKAEEDELAKWSRLRSEYEAEASVASAQRLYDLHSPWAFSGWYWNPWFSTWAWVPASGFWMNPYGFGYWSPAAVYGYAPIRYYGVRHYASAPAAGWRRPTTMGGRSLGGGLRGGRR